MQFQLSFAGASKLFHKAGSFDFLISHYSFGAVCSPCVSSVAEVTREHQSISSARSFPFTALESCVSATGRSQRGDAQGGCSLLMFHIAVPAQAGGAPWTHWIRMVRSQVVDCRPERSQKGLPPNEAAKP